VEGSDFSAVVLWLDKFRDAAYVLAVKSMMGENQIGSVEYVHNLLKGVKGHLPHRCDLNGKVQQSESALIYCIT
jgi:hypothetical protein